MSGDGGWGGGEAFGWGEPIDDGVDLFFGEGTAFFFGEGGHECAGFAVGDPVTPALGVGQGAEHAEVGDHFGAVFGEVADCADGLEEFAAHFSFGGCGVAAGAVSAEDGLAIRGGDLHIAETVGVGLVRDDDIGTHC